MDPIKRKVLLELFAAPSTLLPLAGGLSAWMMSWAIDGNGWLNLLGLAGVLASAGLTATRWIFGLDQIVADAYQYVHDQARQQQEQQLDQLQRRLAGDGDPRTQVLLRDLRRLYDDFHDRTTTGGHRAAALLAAEIVEKLFQAAVKHLEHSYHLWEVAQALTGTPRRKMLEERETVVQEVKRTGEHLGATLEQFHAAGVRENKVELNRLREELDESLLVARRAEERLASLEQDQPDATREFE